MGIGDSEEESSLFQAFTVPTPASIENKNVNNKNDPIKPGTDGVTTKRDDQNELNQSKSNTPAKTLSPTPPPSPPTAPPPPTTTTTTTKKSIVQFEQFARLPDGLNKYVVGNLIGTPLDEIDQSYEDQQTFIVVDANKNLHRYSSTKSLFLFNPINLIRRTAIRILSNTLWTKFIIAIILVNCLYNLTVGSIADVPWELIFLSIYIVELILKVLARGFVLGSFTYLRDPWNCFDFAIIIIGLCSIAIDPTKAIYGKPFLCELRALKIISNSLSLRCTFDRYWKSFLAMRDLLLYIIFILFIVSVICVHMYMGVLKQHCVKKPLSPMSASAWNEFTLNRANFHETNGLYRACGNSSGAQGCPTNYICLAGNGVNPNHGFTSFDSVQRSFLAVFRIVQRDFWEETMQYLLATVGPWHILLFIALIYIISYQLCTLLFVPIALAYNYLRVKQWEKDLLSDLNKAGRPASDEASENKANNAGCLSKFQRSIFYIIYNPYAVLFVIACILLNTLFMALDHHDMSPELSKILLFGNYFFVLVFLIEAILKLTALGILQYFRDGWNTFDFIVTALGVIELSVENVQGLSVLRAFRLLRPLRLAKIVPAFDLVMKRVHHLFSAVGNQTAILCIFIYIFTLFGCRTFGLQYVDNKSAFPSNTIPRWNFTDPYHSFMVIFRAMCGEWIESWFDYVLVGGTWSIVYFAALALVGSFVIMHLFIALILTNDDSAALFSNVNASGIHQEQHQQQEQQPRPSLRQRLAKFDLHTFLKEKLLEPNIQQIYDANKPIKADIEAAQTADAPATTITLQSDESHDKNQSQNNDDNRHTIVHVDDGAATKSAPQPTTAKATATSVVAPLATTEDDDDKDDATINKWSELRVKALKFNENKYFGYVVKAIITIASASLAYLINNFSPALTVTTLVIELAFCIVMIIEFISKIISCGWKSYFKTIWCLIDLFNTIVAVVGLFLMHPAVWILKALRPLSLVSRCPGLKIIVTTIARQIQTLFNSLVICAAFWLIFAIMGVQMFAGKFYHCVDKNQTVLGIDFVPDRETCIMKNYTWINAPVNFDNVLEAYVSLLEVATFKGWIQVLLNAIDARDVDKQPIQDTNLYFFNYFVLFVGLGAFVCANLIVGILIKQILRDGNLSKSLKGSTASMPKLNLSRTISTENLTINDDNDNDRFSVRMTTLARHKYFETIAFVICLTYIISQAFDDADTPHSVIHIIDYVTAVLLICETGLRLHSLRHVFLLNFWNFIDTIIVIFLVIDIAVYEFTHSHLLSIGLLRMGRIVRFNSMITKVSPQLKQAFKSLSQSKWVAYHLGLFLFLITLVYGMIGVVAFGRISHIFPINENISFYRLGRSMIVLIQISTSAGWDMAYIALIKHFNPFLVALYILSYLIICIFITINLVLTVVLNYYTSCVEIAEKATKLNQRDLLEFNGAWQLLAQHDRPLFIQKSQLLQLLQKLDPTSSLRTSFDTSEENVRLLGIPLHEDQTYYRGEVLIALNRARLRQI